MESNRLGDFCIAIDFKKGSAAPSRVFRAMSDLIDACHEFDLDLIQSIDSNIKPVTLLEDIEAGSVKAWLRYVLEDADDEALKNLEWKPIVGKYLVRAKYFVIDFLKDKTEISDRKQLEELEQGIKQLAIDTDVRHIPAYAPVPKQKLIKHIDRITAATTYLTDDDRLIYQTVDDEVSFNLKFRVVPESIEDLITKEEIITRTEMILRVKKPDYLGESRWELKHEGKTIPAKIVDVGWLKSFQRRQVDIRPGDSIRGKIDIITKYGYDMNVVSIKFNVIEVIEVIPCNPYEQRFLEI